MASNDSTLLAIASKGSVDSCASLATRLRALDAELDPSDGLVWFNRWYAALTAALIEGSRRHRFDDAQFVERLACHAGDRYLGALAAHLADPGSGPSCWEPLFQARGRSDVLPVQHGLAGINAHVNHDLAIALVLTCSEIEQVPARDAPAHADYQRIATIIDGVLCDAGVWLESGLRDAPVDSPSDAAPAQARLDPASARAQLGPASARAQLEEALSMWSSKRACEAAWTAAEVRWVLRVTPLISHHHLEALDRMVGLAGRGLLQSGQPSARAERRPSLAPGR